MQKATGNNALAFTADVDIVSWFKIFYKQYFFFLSMVI